LPYFQFNLSSDCFLQLENSLLMSLPKTHFNKLKNVNMCLIHGTNNIFIVVRSLPMKAKGFSSLNHNLYWFEHTTKRLHTNLFKNMKKKNPLLKSIILFIILDSKIRLIHLKAWPFYTYFLPISRIRMQALLSIDIILFCSFDNHLLLLENFAFII